MQMSLEKWREYGWLKSEPSSPEEIVDLLGIVTRALKDGRNWILMWVLLFVFAGAASADPMPEGLIGTWRIVSVYTTKNVYGLHPKEQHKLLGSKVTISANNLASCGQIVEVKSVSTSRITTDDLLFSYRVTFHDLGIKDQSVLRVVINDNEDGNCLGRIALPGEEVYLKSAQEICVTLDGVVFKAIRIKAAKKPTSPHSA
jgi:hypothetical protein